MDKYFNFIFQMCIVIVLSYVMVTTPELKDTITGIFGGLLIGFAGSEIKNKLM